jgi:hypothetical protein
MSSAISYLCSNGSDCLKIAGIHMAICLSIDGLLKTGPKNVSAWKTCIDLPLLLVKFSMKLRDYAINSSDYEDLAIHLEYSATARLILKKELLRFSIFSYREKLKSSAKALNGYKHTINKIPLNDPKNTSMSFQNISIGPKNLCFRRKNKMSWENSILSLNKLYCRGYCHSYEILKTLNKSITKIIKSHSEIKSLVEINRLIDVSNNIIKNLDFSVSKQSMSFKLKNLYRGYDEIIFSNIVQLNLIRLAYSTKLTSRQDACIFEDIELYEELNILKRTFSNLINNRLPEAINIAVKSLLTGFYNRGYKHTQIDVSRLMKIYQTLLNLNNQNY